MNKKNRPCLRCDRIIKVNTDYRLCAACRKHIAFENMDGGLKSRQIMKEVKTVND